MSTDTFAAPENFAAELVRRGLPVEYAERAAAECADHYRDLVDELLASGLDESAAQAQARARLGDARALVRKMARDYQRRYWCGRWPLLSFSLTPLPLATGAWIVAGFFSVQTYECVGGIGQWFGMSAPAPATIATIKLILLGGSTAVLAPLLLTLLFCRLARRAGCDRRWALLSVAQIAFLASLLCFHLDCANGRLFFEPALLRDLFFAETLTGFLRSYFVQPSQALQLALPLVAFAIFRWVERRQQQEFVGSRLTKTA